MSFVEWLPLVRLISTKNIPDPCPLPATRFIRAMACVFRLETVERVTSMI